MANYDNDAALQELHDELYREEEARSQTGFSRMDDKSKMWIALLIGAVVLLYFMNKITSTQALIFGAVMAVIIYLLKGSNQGPKELTYLECLIRLYDLLDFMQQHPIGTHEQIPKGQIRLMPVGRKQWYDGKAFKRSFKVGIYDEDLDVEDYYFIELDVFTGDILTFREAPEGVRGDETKDIKLMPTPDMLMSKKRDQFMGKSRGDR
jgi:hypothetical protein